LAIIRSYIPFSDEYIPPVLYGRDAEIYTIHKFLEPLKRQQPTASNLFITGGVGVGKTVVAKFVRLNIPKEINSCYVQLNEQHTTHQILAEISRSFFPDIQIYGRATAELLSDFLNRMQKTPAVVIIDEVDKVPLATLRPILHSFTRLSWMSLILLSRLPGVLTELPVDTKDSLRCRTLVFKPYNKDQLKGILFQRAELALHPNAINEEAVDCIAEYAAYFGNARLAIDILKTACEEAEMSGNTTVTRKEAENAIEIVEEQSLEKAIVDLPLTYRLLLYAIMDISKLQPAEYKRVFYRWQTLLQHAGLPTFSKWKFYDIVLDLKKLDFIKTEKRGRGRGQGFLNVLVIPENMQTILERLKETR